MAIALVAGGGTARGVILKLDQIRAGYQRVEVLRGVSLTVPSRSVVALLGANGAGKTTLLRVAAGLLRPSSGRILLDGEPVEHRSAHQRTRAGLCLIPEGRGIFPRLTVRENISMQVGGRRVADAVERAVSAFPQMGERLDQLAGTMSGGQQQMLAVARALVTESQVVLADELSLGLAPVLVDEIFEALAELRASGRSVLIVEQYVERVLGLADYVYVLHKGQIVFVGEPAQFRERSLFEQYLGGAA